MENKKSFAIIAILVGAVGVGLGIYTITLAGSELIQPGSSTESNPDQQRFESLLEDGSPILGSSNAPLTIIEFGDYQCSNCYRFNTQVKPMIMENYIDAGKVNLVFKDFTIYGRDSVNGAIATYCADEQNRYWEMHDYIYQNQRAVRSGWLSTENIRGFASDLGLDMQQFNTCYDEQRYDDRVMNNFEDGKSLGVTGTPTFLVFDNSGESETIRGAQPYSVFEQVLDRMLVN